MMAFYSRKCLLSRCFWWKGFTSIQTSRHCSIKGQHYHQFPLDSTTWDSLKSLGILRQFRGKSGNRSKAKSDGDISTISTCHRTSSELNIQVTHTRSTSMNTAAKQHKRSLRGININNLCYPPRLPLFSNIQRSSKLCLLNCRSVCNKSLILNDYIIENEVELLCITETWLNKNNLNMQLTINEMTPKGYVFHHVPRNSRGGGVGLLYKKSLDLKKITISKFKSFEIMGMLLNASPTPSEFSQFLEQFSIHSPSFLLVGDFNFHVEDPCNQHAQEFLNILNIFNLTQHVKHPTYKDQHILDLVITNENCNFIDKIIVSDPMISDHSAVFCEIFTNKPRFEMVVSKCRKINSIKIESFVKDITECSLVTSPADDITGITLQYHSELQSLLDVHAPSKQRIVSRRPPTPWYTEEIKTEKVKRRKLERTWRKSRLTIDRDIFVQQCLVVKKHSINGYT